MYTFHEYVTVVPGATEAIDTLKQLVTKHDPNAVITKRPGSPILPCSSIFKKTTKNLSFGWGDVCKVLGISDGFKVPQRPVSPESVKAVPVDSLVATQPTLFADIVERKIASPMDLWSPHEIPLFVEQHGKLYIFDGHHRVAAALLLKLDTIPGQIVKL